MTRPGNPLFDDRVAEWLEADPDTAPPQVLETVVAALPSIAQRTRRRPWAMNPFARLGLIGQLGATAAVIVVVVLAFNVLKAPTVGPQTSPTPSRPAASTPGSSGEIRFTSPVYGYTVSYPAGWNLIAGKYAIHAEGLPCALCEEPDNFWIKPDAVTVTISANRLSDGTTGAAWTASVNERIPVRFHGFAGCLKSQEPIAVAGEPGTLSLYDCYEAVALWITVVHAGTGYNIIWTDLPGADPATIRPTFGAFVGSFVFGSPVLPTVGPTVTPGPTGGPLPDAILGAWHHTAPAWMWFFRSGDPACTGFARTQLDCAIWQPEGKVREVAVATLTGTVLSMQWLSGFCTGVTSTYSATLAGDSLNLVELPGGCQGGDLALTRAGTGSAPTAPPVPAP